MNNESGGSGRDDRGGPGWDGRGSGRTDRSGSGWDEPPRSVWDDTAIREGRTGFPPPPPVPPYPPAPQAPGALPEPGGTRNGLVWFLAAVVVVLLLALAGVIGYFVAARDTGTPSASPGASQSGQAGPGGVTAGETASGDPEQAQSEAAASDRAEQDRVTVTETAVAVEGPSAPASGGVGASGDLGLSVPLTRPACDGRGIVVLYSAVTPGQYAQEIATALAQNPGASYLRTDMACPSLRQRDENGNVIYAVYRPSGYSQAELCADVRAAGPPAYGRWLDTTSDPSVLVTC